MFLSEINGLVAKVAFSPHSCLRIGLFADSVALPITLTGNALWWLGLNLGQDHLEKPLQVLPGLKVNRLAGDDMFHPPFAL